VSAVGFAFELVLLHRRHSSFISNNTGDTVDTPYRVEKPWGYELIWAKTEKYVGKILHVEPGHLLSLQYHERKDETIYMLTGEIIFRVQEGGNLVERRMKEGENYHITPGTIHQMEAIVPSDMLEASTPELDDVVRIEDRYGRAG
jgi:mannose-6-phosphate isomerase-like protein (cupin superfamily)